MRFYVQQDDCVIYLSFSCDRTRKGRKETDSREGFLQAFCRGVIATGNHKDSDPLRGALPPLRIPNPKVSGEDVPIFALPRFDLPIAWSLSE